MCEVCKNTETSSTEIVGSEKAAATIAMVDILNKMSDDTPVAANSTVQLDLTPGEYAYLAPMLEEIRGKQDMASIIRETRSLFDPTYLRITNRIKQAGAPFHSNSNISAFIRAGEIEELVDEATDAFATVLDTLIIDRENDPNAMDTARRMAKMYIYELMSGRYEPMPKITAFPNQHTGKETGFGGMLVVRAEIKSMCSHHHQVVDGVAYIGILPKEKVIGLSKYTRLAQWLSRRGTLQEELAEDIASGIMAATDSEDVAVFIEATHGCCQNRGILSKNSTTNTTVLHGEFLHNGTVRKEFHDNIMFQKMNNTSI